MASCGKLLFSDINIETVKFSPRTRRVARKTGYTDTQYYKLTIVSRQRKASRENTASTVQKMLS
jgi:hypothetical protein